MSGRAGCISRPLFAPAGALDWAVGAYVPARIDIVAMLRYYGAVNALEFALPGVLTWHLMPDGRKGGG